MNSDIQISRGIEFKEMDEKLSILHIHILIDTDFLSTGSAVEIITFVKITLHRSNCSCSKDYTNVCLDCTRTTKC